MDDHFGEYGSITLKKDLVLFHGSSEKFEEIGRNQFFAYDIKNAGHNASFDKRDELYIYKLKEDIKLLLTVKFEKRDKSYLSDILFWELGDFDYLNYDDVTEIKRNRPLLDGLCGKLSDRYEGLFNQMDGAGTYEVVIFDTKKYLEKITDGKERIGCIYDNMKYDDVDIKNMLK